MSEGGESNAATLFLLDGLLRNPSPVVLLAADSSIATSLALKLHSGSVEWDDLPKTSGELYSLQTAMVVGLDAEQARALCRELTGTPDWLYIEKVDYLLDSPGGREFLTELTTSVANGELAMVILMTQPEQLDRVRSAFPRLVGFATIMARSGETGTFEGSQVTSIVTTARDRDDSGWIIIVRFELTEPITPYAPFDGDPATGGVMELVDSVRVIDSADSPPMGAMIGFSPDAFTLTQEAAAFAAAELAAQRVIGRAMRQGERVTSTRGIYYA